MTAAQENYLDIAFDKGLQLTFPPVLVQLLRALLAPSPSFKAITSFLQIDPMLTGKVLHIVNSSSYGFNSRITDLERAAIAIGTNELLKLVIALSLQKRLAPKSKRGAKYDHGDWSMTLWSAIAAEAIASRLCPAQSQEAYLAGMLKDLPLYLELCREEVPPFLARPRLATLPWPGQMAEELTHWGYSHPELSRDIFLYWGLPIELAEAVRLHHDFAHKASHSRLAQSVIYATRWAELLHAPGADPGQAVAFELAMAAELGLDQDSAETFRSSCAEKFDRLLDQLGVQRNACPQPTLHGQPLPAIQRSYFLALGVLSDSAPFSPAFAATLQRYLRLFWDQTSFELCLHPPDAEASSLFRSLAGAALIEEAVDRDKTVPRLGWFSLPITGREDTYGFLALPRQPKENGDEASLPMFVRALGMQIENYLAHDTRVCGAENDGLPFALARVDADGVIRDVSRRFERLLSTPGQPASSLIGMKAEELLERHFGVFLPPDKKKGQENPRVPDSEQGQLVSPVKSIPGLPMYMGIGPDLKTKGHSCLFLGELTCAPPLQSLALSHSGLMEILLRALHAHACLLNASGTVVWADASLRHMLGANIFAISRPETSRQNGWNASFLSTLTGIARLNASVASAAAAPKTHELIFAPLRESRDPAYLMLVGSDAAA